MPAATEIKVQQVIQRDGSIVNFSFQKISDSIFRAAQSIGGKDREQSIFLAHKVVEALNENFHDNSPRVEDVQELIEGTLIRAGHTKTTKAYILRHHKKSEEREQRALIMGESNPEDNLNFSNEALSILERRYLLKDEHGNLIETPKEMVRRVARNIATADTFYGANETEIKIYEEQFYQMMAELRFLPNSPTLINAETKTQQLSSCVVLPIEDTMPSIFGSLRDAALIHQSGTGTGFSFSRLRPKGDAVNNNLGVASGPVAFLRVYDSALETIKQGGVRPGANMAVLRVDHPDIIRFIESKRDRKSLKNFNISVGVTDNFMRAVEADRDYFLVSPKTSKHIGKLRARDVFSIIIQNAWKTGDPGLVFIDEINRKHPAKHLGDIETTNQCGEAPLLPYEGCVLGSINLNKFINIDKNDLEWDSLRDTVGTAVHFLDNVIDMNSYKKPEIEQQTKNSRKFGLGLMGFADMFFTLKTKYDSEQGLDMAERIISFIKEAAYDKSVELAQTRGPCPAWNGSDHQRQGRKMRNMTCISIAPTGTISLLAGASPSCEPLFALSYQRTVLGSNEIVYLNKTFENTARERGFYSPELIRRIARSGRVQTCKEVPKDIRDIFVTAQDISPEWHVKMQATLQKHVDNSISKTINFPSTASIKDVENAYMLAWKSKCKGITIYRDGSYEGQVINIGD
jgi:ribonucleoside-diphosphate reductase alpha chain